MKIIVHRGTKQIGGTCIELSTANTRIILDIGLPLTTTEEDDINLNQTVECLCESGVLPVIDGLYVGNNALVDAVFISHIHQDHIGLAHFVNNSIPVYATNGTWALMDVMAIFINKSNPVLNRKVLSEKDPVKVGDFVITSYQVDHSAPDAVAFLIEADGKRVLYSGDLRAHGRKHYMWSSLLKKLSGSIDALLIEGTTIGRTDTEMLTEDDLENQLLPYFNKSLLSVVICSSQNIDRLVTIFRAVKRTGKIMVIDLYTAYNLYALRSISKSLPQYDWNEIRVVPWWYQQQRLKESNKTDFIELTRSKWIRWKELVNRAHDIVLLMRSNRKINDLETHFGDEVKNVQIIWSLWEGYWDKDNLIRKFCEKYQIAKISIHTSGHASWLDLKRFIDRLQPKIIIPVHTEKASQFANDYDNVRLLDDCELFEVQ